MRVSGQEHSSAHTAQSCPELRLLQQEQEGQLKATGCVLLQQLRVGCMARLGWKHAAHRIWPWESGDPQILGLPESASLLGALTPCCGVKRTQQT